MLASTRSTANSIFTLTLKRGFSSVTINLPPVEVHRLDKNQLPTKIQTNKDEAMKLYGDMLRMRRLEIACDNLYKNREIRGFCHLYDGQEAIAAGMEAALTFQDPLITAYRDHCQQLLRGDTATQIIAEMLGKKTGSTQGKGGSMHLYRKKNEFYGGNGIVGAQCPVGTGLAFALKYLKKPNCAIVMYGDGAANQGQLFEAANMASLWKLPVIYVCENNRYGMGTSVKRAAANPNHYQRLDPIPGLRVDGNNIFAVKAITAWAKEWCVKDNGPLCIEFDTYRYHGHSMSDPGISYRSRDEVANIRKERDCIEKLKAVILENKFATEADLKNIDRDVKAEMDKAVEEARAAPLPDDKELIADVLIEKQPYFIRNVEYSKSWNFDH